MKILQLTVHFSPNVGGVETHLSDLVDGLMEKGHKVFVLAYQPLMTRTDWSIWQNLGELKILRLPWIPGLFYRLVDKPILEFLYLLPGLFFVTPFVIFINRPEVIHAHGLVAGFVGTFWGKAFGKRVVISTHSIYHFPEEGFYTKFVKAIFSRADKILTLSEKSREEVINLRISKEKVEKFTYWIDLDKFRPQEDQSVADKPKSISSYSVKASRDRQNSKVRVRKQLKLVRDSFIVFFVGRLVEEKGILVAIEAAKKWNKNIHFVIAGDGPLKTQISDLKFQNFNIHYLGRVDQDDLPKYYSAADIVLVPSTHDEGFGRVILESLACGTPIVAAKRGAIPEAMNESVGRLIKVTPKNIKKAIEELYGDDKKLNGLAKNAREFAERRYSIKNINTIISAYKENGK